MKNNDTGLQYIKHCSINNFKLGTCNQRIPSISYKFIKQLSKGSLEYTFMYIKENVSML